MGETSNFRQDQKNINDSSDESEIKYMDGQQPYRTQCGLCCVCHTLPSRYRSYYGHVFCTECFHKYIWSPSKRECSGDILKKDDEKTSLVKNSAK